MKVAMKMRPCVFGQSAIDVMVSWNRVEVLPLKIKPLEKCLEKVCRPTKFFLLPPICGVPGKAHQIDGAILEDPIQIVFPGVTQHTSAPP
jgi:hypothetical protein